MCHGHGIGGTQKKMCTVKCGHGKFSCMLFKSLDFLDISLKPFQDAMSILFV